MKHNQTPARTRPLRGPAIVVAVVSALALLAVGAQHVTARVLGDGSNAGTSAAGGGSVAGTPAGPALEPGPPGRPGAGAGAQPPPGDGEAVQGTMTVGPVTADEPFHFVPAPDRITIEPGADAAARALLPRPPDGGGPVAGTGDSGDGGGDGDLDGGPGTIEGDADASADKPIDATVDLTLGVRVETTGHLASIHAGVGGGLDGGLAALSIDFGDGQVRQLSDDQVAQLRPSGRLIVVHTYEPTLTPQRQEVLVTAVDGAGRSHLRQVQFETRAAYRLSYSPLTVTALDDCDTFGKGDFTLTWQLDSRPARSSKFKLGRNESYVEDGFQVGVGPLFYDEPLEHFEVSIEERDPSGARLAAFWRWDGITFKGAPFDHPFSLGPVAQFGNHQYEVELRSSDVESSGGDDCAVTMTFTAFLVMIESLDR